MDLLAFIDESTAKMEDEIKHGVHDIGDTSPILTFVQYIRENKEDIYWELRRRLPGKIIFGVKWQARKAVPFISIDETIVLAWDQEKPKL